MTSFRKVHLACFEIVIRFAHVKTKTILKRYMMAKNKSQLPPVSE